MTTRPEISIVVPVFNAGDRFRPCMESLVNQTLDHSRYEIVLVDDGSSDGCEHICDEYAEKYPSFVRTFHQPPSGYASYPRNRGIDEALGEFIFFQDADDIMLPEACERMLTHAREWGSDVLVVRQTFRWPDGREEVSPSYAARTHPCVPRGPRFAEAFTADMHLRRLYRRDLILESGLRFKNTLSEDFLFNEEIMYYANTVSFANDYTYVWYMQWEVGNISSSQFPPEVKTFDGRLRGIKWMLDFIDEKNLRGEAYPYLYKKILEHPVYRMLTTAMDQRSWDEELPRMGELKDVLADHWDYCVAEKVKFTERAVIEALMIGQYELMPAVRYLGRRSAKAQTGFKLSTDWSLHSEGVSSVFGPLSGLSEFVRHGLITRQLNALEVSKAVSSVEGAKVRFEVALSFPQMAAMITEANLVAIDKAGSETVIPLELISGCEQDVFELMEKGCTLPYAGEFSLGDQQAHEYKFELVARIGQHTVRVKNPGLSIPKPAQKSTCSKLKKKLGFGK